VAPVVPLTTKPTPEAQPSQAKAAEGCHRKDDRALIALDPVSEFFAARIRAEWQDWSFGANQAAVRAAAAEELVALRRQFAELAEQDLRRLAQSWRPDGSAGPFFTFIAADGSSLHDAEPAAVIVDAAFVSALLHELADQGPDALTALLDRWAEQRRHAAFAGLRPTPAEPPRVALLLPRDASHWPPASWDRLLALELDAPDFDGALLRWDAIGVRWVSRSRSGNGEHQP
jgi:hypothetical protein